MSRINVRVFQSWLASDRGKPSKELSAIKVDDNVNKAKMKQAVRKALTEKGWNVLAVNFTAGKEGGFGMSATVTHDPINQRGVARGKPVRRTGPQGGDLGSNMAKQVKGVHQRAKEHGRGVKPKR